jgi:hypothetical protein
MHSEELGTVEAALTARFRALKAQRGGAPVYALEHGLSSAELQRLRLTIGPMLRLGGVDPAWSHMSLPLIVLATEAGYRYRGTGTDFWPVLSSRLGASFTDRDRNNLSALFETANRTLAIKKPAPTAWNLAFRHIAWPIANAVAPVEIHRALAKALHRMFVRPPSTFEGADLAAALRRAALADGAPDRLLQWLEDDQLAAAMSRRLLELPDESLLDALVVRRIWSDMSNDIVTRRALGNALAEHRQLQSGGRGFGRYGRAHFALRVTDGGPALQIVPPILGPADHDRLARQVQGRRARLWNVSDAVDLQSLCEGRPTPIELEQIPEVGSVFLSDHSLAGLEGTAVTALRGLEPDLAGPLLFPAAPGVSAQAEVIRPGSSRHWWWVGRRRTTTVTGVRHIGRVAGSDVVEIDIDEADARSWLQEQGIPVERGPVLEPVLASILTRQPRGHNFPSGLPALFRVTGSADGTTAVLGRTEVDLSEDRSFVVVDGDLLGDHELRLRSAWPDTVGAWRRLSSNSAEPAPISIAPDAGELTLEALLDGEISMRLVAAPGLVTPALSLSVIVGGAEIARVRTDTDGPELFGGGSTLLRELTGQLKISGSFERGELVAELDGFCRESWPIGRRLRTARWERHEDSWTPLVDGASVQVVCVSAETPQRQPAGPTGTTGPALLLPILDDGRVLDGDGLIVGPRSLAFGLSVSNEDLGGLERSWESAEDDGLKATSSAWVRWSCAATSHLILDLVRGRAVQSLERMTVRQLCGRGWLGLEDDLVGSSSDFWGALASLAITRGMATGEGFPALADVNRGSLQDCLAARFEATAPHLRALPPTEIEELAPALDEAVNEAWEDHFQALERAGAGFHLEDECDAGNDGSVWAAAVRDAEDRYQLAPLGRMITSERRSRALMTFNYESEGLPALAALLETEHVDLRPRTPHWLASGDILKSLMFWTDPRGFAQEGEGSESLQRLLADRQTARAIRYAALRYALSRGRLGGSR